MVPYDEATLLGGNTYIAASPYVIAMKRLKTPILPHVVNALLLTTILSAGKAYTFSASRALHGLALTGKAPKIFRRVKRHGVPYLAVIMTVAIGAISYLSLSNGTAKVLSWILNLSTSSQCLNWVIMSAT